MELNLYCTDCGKSFYSSAAIGARDYAESCPACQGTLVSVDSRGARTSASIYRLPPQRAPRSSVARKAAWG